MKPKQIQNHEITKPKTENRVFRLPIIQMDMTQITKRTYKTTHYIAYEMNVQIQDTQTLESDQVKLIGFRLKMQPKLSSPKPVFSLQSSPSLPLFQAHDQTRKP